MSEETMFMFCLVMQTVVLGTLVMLMAQMLIHHRLSQMGAFYAFGITAMLLSDLYWIAYTLLEPGTRMPFAVNEIGECATFLLLGEAARTGIPNGRRICPRDVVLPALFMVCNTALWIAWSGEWVQDIFCGMTLCYYVVAVTCLLRQEDSRTRRYGVGFALCAALLVTLQAATFVAPEGMQAALNAVLTVLTIGSLLLLIWICVRAASTGARAALALSFGGFGWAEFCMYMSEGVPYLLGGLSATLSLALMYLAIQRQVSAA